MKTIKKILFSLAVFTFFFATTPLAMAIGIKPVRREVSVNPGESLTREVTVLNETDEDFLAEPVIQVFYRNNETGTPVVPNQNDEDIKAIRSWIDISDDAVFVPAGGVAEVPYSVNVPKNAKAGGRYVMIAYQPVIDADSGIKVNVRAASLLYIHVKGVVMQNGEVTHFDLPAESKTEPPFTFDVTFKNSGNTHVKPMGQIKITDTKTGNQLKQVAQYVDPHSKKLVQSDLIPVNMSEANVLPGSSRMFKGEWVNHLRAGSYRADLSLKYGREAIPVSQSFEFVIEKGFGEDEPSKNPVAVLLAVVLVAVWGVLKKNPRRRKK